MISARSAVAAAIHRTIPQNSSSEMMQASQAITVQFISSHLPLRNTQASQGE